MRGMEADEADLRGRGDTDPGRADPRGAEPSETEPYETEPHGTGPRGQGHTGPRRTDPRGAGGWWRRKSSPAKVETYTRWSFHFFALAEFTAVGVPLGSGVWRGSLLWLPLIMAVHCVLSAVTASRALDWTRGRRPRPVRLMATFAVLTAIVAAVALATSEHGPGGEAAGTAAGGVFGVALVFAACVTTLGVRGWRQALAVVAGHSVGAGALALLLGAPGPAVLASIAAVLVGGGFMATTSVFSVWLLDTVYRLDEARETRARLAVAEERLRFGRDLHDVMGRNLAVIALKSELAVQLARRGRPEAVEQMIEVQRIARESQREVRDVVRGYREADLGVELVGAQGVLTAAGIDCEVRGEVGGLPADVQSALGWVVRETTTNVLRHGDAGRCAVEVRVTGGKVVLTVENDGADGGGSAGDGTAAGGPTGGGSGLAGLAERLRKVGGTLEAGSAGAGVFRVVAEVPLVVEGAVVSEVAS
ncbi:histidine kinase [Streptomyces sp. NPDC006622]|uniref:sensor histidine kinase n=1 Tax=Streptomyces sp. NPDC006622 TaxID=3155459 RepID=UPI00339E26B9